MLIQLKNATVIDARKVTPKEGNPFASFQIAERRADGDKNVFQFAGDVDLLSQIEDLSHHEVLELEVNGYVREYNTKLSIVKVGVNTAKPKS